MITDPDTVQLTITIRGKWASAFGIAPIARQALERLIGANIWGIMRSIGNYEADLTYQVTLTPIVENDNTRRRILPTWYGYMLWLLDEIRFRLEQSGQELTQMREGNNDGRDER